MMSPLPATHRRHSLRLKGYDYALAGAYYVTICIHGRMCLLGEVAGGAMRTNPAGDMVIRWWQELAHKYPGVIPDVHVVMPNHFHGVIIISSDPVGADLRVRPGVAGVRPGVAGVRPGVAGVRPGVAGVHPGVGDVRAGVGDVRAGVAGVRPGVGDSKTRDAGGHVQYEGGHPGPPPPQGATARDVGGHAGPPLPRDETGRTVGGDVGAPPPQGTPTRDVGGHTGPPLPEIVQWFKTMTTNAYIRGVKTEGWPPFEGRFWQRGYYEHIIRSDDEYARIGEHIVRNPAQWASDRENPLAARKGTPDPWQR